MITQAILDFVRDIVQNWVTGAGALLLGIDADSAGAAVGGVAGSAGHFLALFIAPGVWGAIIAAWGTWIAIWLATGLIAIVARRGTSS